MQIIFNMSNLLFLLIIRLDIFKDNKLKTIILNYFIKPLKKLLFYLYSYINNESLVSIMNLLNLYV